MEWMTYVLVPAGVSEGDLVTEGLEGLARLLLGGGLSGLRGFGLRRRRGCLGLGLGLGLSVQGADQ